MIRFNDWTIDRSTLTVTHGAYRYHFNGKKGNERKYIPSGMSGRFLVIEHLLLANRPTRDSLFEYIYGNNLEGGPEVGTKQIDVMVHMMKLEVFPKLNCYLRSARGAGQMWYYIKPLFEAPDVVRQSA